MPKPDVTTTGLGKNKHQPILTTSIQNQIDSIAPSGTRLDRHGLDQIRFSRPIIAQMAIDLWKFIHAMPLRPKYERLLER